MDRCRRRLVVSAAVAAVLCVPLAAPAGDANIPLPVADIERELRTGTFEIDSAVGNRFEDDRTQRVVLRLADGSLIEVKWAAFAKGGEKFNNSPRCEVAAYELQKLFLDEPEMVVPPTVARAFGLEWYRRHFPGATPTFEDTSSVLVTLQYWLSDVDNLAEVDEGRFASDPAYARAIANLVIFTYLALHGDSNKGNFLISSDPARPRAFAVDNGIAFTSEESDRGAEWSRLLVDRLPRATIDRLRRISEADLEAALAVVAQYEIVDGRVMAVPRTAPIAPKSGVRRRDGVVQLGLSSWEIHCVSSRLERLLRHVDRGKLELF